MHWKKFPYREPSYAYSLAALKKAWKDLHAGDAEAPPVNSALLGAWASFHAGDFERAASLGLAEGIDGYTVANKATAIYANYLEPSAEKRLSLLLAVAARCEQQQAEQPRNPAGYYWRAYALGRYSQQISVVKALAQGIGGKVKGDLEHAVKLAPRHADAHIALGTYHAEVIDKIGAVVGALTYGASKEQSHRHFLRALELNPGSAIARVEFANALLMLGGRKEAEQARALYREAAASTPRDAMERLDVELARGKAEA